MSDSPKRGIGRACVLLIASSLFACPGMPRACGKEPAAAPGAAQAAKESGPRAAPVPLDPFERRAALDATYRLAPDRRMLIAAEAVQRFFDPANAARATTVQDGQLWRIRIGPVEVGTLPDLPEFQQLLSVLEAFARRLSAGHPVSGGAPAEDASLPPLDWEPEAIAALREAQDRWLKGDRAAPVVRRAARALASLAFEDVDTLGVGDRLPAQALAMLAVTRALGIDAAREEALTAAALGYSSAAQRAAARLPERDALRLFLEGSPALADVARGGAVGARYLQLAALRRADDEEGETRWLETEMAAEQRTLPVMALRLHARHGWRSPVAEEMPAAVLLAAAVQAGDPPGATKAVVGGAGFPEGRLLASASALIGRVDASAAGPFYDATILQSYDRSMLYSALAQWSDRLIDGLDSPDAAKELSRLLGQDDAPEARDFQRWLLLRVAAKLPDPLVAGAGAPAALHDGLSAELEKLLFGGANRQAPQTVRQRLMDALSGLQTLGPAATLQLFEELKTRLDWADTTAVTATRALVVKLDSRVDHRIRFAHLAWDALHDLALEERLMRSALRDARQSHPRMVVAFAANDGDAGLLQELATGAVPYRVRVDAMAALERMGKLSLSQLEDEVEQVQKAHPSSSHPTNVLIDAFTEHEEYGKGAEAARRWLARNEERQELDVAIMHATLGRALYTARRYDEAWHAVEPYLPSWQGSVMRTAADVAIARGRSNEAREILAKYVARYPDATGAARSYWLLRDYDAAAQFLAHLPKAPTEQEWDWEIGKDFAEVIGPLPVEEARNATAAMQKAGLGPPALVGVANALYRAGFSEQAFQIASALADRPPSPRAGPPLILRAYMYLKKWKGEESALTWIRSTPFANAGGSVAQLVYHYGAYGLLWDLLPEPPPGASADNFWLQRTASLLLDPKLATAQRENVAHERYRGNGQSHYHELGKFLIGQLDEHAVAKLVTDPEKACEVSYYMGLKAETENHLQDATAWYRNAVESANPRWAEYQWAYASLQRLQSSGKTLRRLETERISSVTSATKD